MSEKHLKFRYAERKDTALILKFIKELAAYEKMEHEVIATEAVLEEWIFCLLYTSEQVDIFRTFYSKYKGIPDTRPIVAVSYTHIDVYKRQAHRGRRAVGGREGKRAAGSTDLSGIMLPYSTGSPCDE